MTRFYTTHLKCSGILFYRGDAKGSKRTGDDGEGDDAQRWKIKGVVQEVSQNVPSDHNQRYFSLSQQTDRQTDFFFLTEFSPIQSKGLQQWTSVSLIS